MDWNWFFSSMAQSAAAIVAVFSAFIITKIMNNQAQFEGNKRRIKTSLHESMKFKELAKYRRIGWYCQYLDNKETKKLREKHDNREISCSPEEYYFNSNFPIFVKRDGVIEKIAWVFKLPITAKAQNSIESAFINIKPARELSEDQLITEEQNKIYGLIADIKHHVTTLNDFIDELSSNHESSPIIKWSIIASMSLFAIGVIYPLGFLPLSQNATMDLSVAYISESVLSIRGALLSIFALIFASINLYFLSINSGMVYDKPAIDELKAHSNFEGYSVYFENMEDNERAKDEFFKKVEEDKGKKKEE